MKIRLIYILLISICLFASCNNESGGLIENSDNKLDITFNMTSTDFVSYPSTRATNESINRIYLLLFDANDKLIDCVAATDINPTTRTFKANVMVQTKVIHFIANHEDMASLDLTANLGKSEKTVIPAMTVADNKLVFWARNVISDIHKTTVVFIRNQAKITVSNMIQETGINFIGYGVCNYATTGSVSTFVDGKFDYTSDVATVVPSMSSPILSNDQSANTGIDEEKYICEYKNPYGSKELFVILHFTRIVNNVSQNLFYKVLLRDKDNNLYQMVRNVNYRIVIKKIPYEFGERTYEEAIKAKPINSLYAEIMKDANTITEGGNLLTVSPLVQIVNNGGDFQSEITTIGQGTFSYNIISDPLSILSGLTYKEPYVKGFIAATQIKQEAKIRVKFGQLERIMTIISSPKYKFECKATPSGYINAGANIALTFTIDANYPSIRDYPELYPIYIYIKAKNMHPADNKNMFIDHTYNPKPGEFWYRYITHTLGTHTINFKTNFSHPGSDEINIESNYFAPTTIVLNKTP